MVYNVTTWEQFLRAYTIAHDVGDPDDDVIEIMADMDWNEVTMSNPIYAGGKKTINGNSHTIYNLHDGRLTGTTIFSNGDGNTHPYYNVTWNKINFDNLFIVMSNYGAFWGSNSNFMIFNDCTFVCKCLKEVFRFCKLNRCAITFENLSATNRPFEYVESNFCWYSVKIRKTASADTSSIFRSMDTCYIEGKILCSATHAGTLGQLINCCVNVQTDVPVFRISSSSTSTITVYNTDKIPSVTNPVATAIGVTDAQMHDAQYLESIGFAIIAQAGE